MPRMQPVESSCVEAVGYDAKLRELYVRYVGGHTYRYRHVPEAVYQELLAAPSKGTYMNQVIKPNYPDYEEL